MQELFYRFISFISFDFGSSAYVICAVLTFLLLFITMLEILSLIIFKSKIDLTYYVCYLVINFTITLYFAVQDFIGQKIVFDSGYKIYVFITALISVSILLYAIVRVFNYKIVKPKNKNQKVKDMESAESLEPSNYVKFVLEEKPFEGYLNVNYVKKLISELKGHNLTQGEYEQIEEFELFLLNFVSRQPKNSERRVLSEYMSMLIKKIAKYKG